MKRLFFVFIAAFMLFASCKLSDDSTDVTIENDTDRAITFTSFSVDIDAPLTIESGKSCSLSYTDHVEAFDFVLTYDGTSYSGSTNYVQDYAKYSVRIYSEDGTLKSRTSGSHHHPMTLRAQ